MKSKAFTESVVEEAALAWLEGLGYVVLSGPAVVPGEPGAVRNQYGQVVLGGQLGEALQRLNPEVPEEALEDAFRKLTRPDSPSLVGNNHAIHKYLVEGVPVEYQRADGSIGGDLVRVLDYDDPENNEFLAVNQFTVVEDGHERRADVVLFVNGLPLAVIELKNAAAGDADIWKAFNQLQTYKQQIPSLFQYNAAMVVSDGVEARIGTLTANREWFMPWRTIEGEELADARLSQLQVLLEGVFEQRRLLDLIRYFIVFEDAGVAFFQAVKSVLTKSTSEGQRSPEEVDQAIRQIVSRAVASDEVVDIFAAAGLNKPDISILSDDFLAEVRGMPQRNLAVEMLRKLLMGEIKSRSRRNVVQARSFAEMLETAIKRYQNRAIETAQVIEELISLAQDLREAGRRGEELGLTDDEVAFYDALETNDSAVAVLGDDTLRLIAQELVRAVRGSVTIDWSVRENVRAQIRVIIKRILRKYGYPPDKQARATDLVLEQAEVLCAGWAADS